MGTSASNTGPTGRIPLLPNWAPDAFPDASPDVEEDFDKTDGGDPASELPKSTEDSKTKPTTKLPQQTNSWRSARSAIREYASNKTKENLKKSGKRYVRTYGGAGAATRASAKGIDYGLALGTFLGGFSQGGYEANLQRYDLSECIGKSSEEVLARIADRIAPIGSTNDEAIARGAIMDSLDNLYERIVTDGGDIESLGSLDEITLKETVMEFVSNYIFKKWIYELGLALEKNNLSEKAVIRLENEIRSFIKNEVQFALKDKDVKALDLREGEGRKVIQEIFELAYLTIEK